MTGILRTDVHCFGILGPPVYVFAPRSYSAVHRAVEAEYFPAYGIMAWDSSPSILSLVAT
jgi:hypothetical protein